MEEKKEFKPQAIVEVLASGPLKITGNFILKDLKRDTESSPGEILLCLCGRSSKKPLCDDSHLK
jgi:CDGSH-type Zn-finger protein